MHKYRGIFHSAVGGDGYVTVTKSGREYDIPVTPGAAVAFEGDSVEIFTQGELSLIFAPGSAYKLKCRITEVLERACDVVTGEYVVSEKVPFIVPDTYIPYRVRIKGDADSPKCSHGDKIKARILKYRSFSAIRANPIANFGRADTFRANFNAAVHGTGHYAPFSAAAEKQAGAARPCEALNYLNKRRDLRGKTVFTFSDTGAEQNSFAFSVSCSEGEWVLWLHVADVAECLEPGSPLDLEAARRGKALFPGRDGSPVLPAGFRRMVCDLGLERPLLAVSAFVTFDRDGNVLDTDLCESVIDPVLTASASDVSVDPEKQVTGVSLVPRSDSALMAAELLAAVGSACAEKMWYSGAGCVYSSLAERHYNIATGAPYDRYFLEPEKYFAPGYTALEAEKVRGKAAEHYLFARLTDESGDADLSFVPAPHYLIGSEKYMRFHDPAERYSDLINLRAIKAFVRETPFDVKRYAPALQAEMSTYALKRRLAGLFECSYAAKCGGAELKATAIKNTVGGTVVLLENGICSFIPSSDNSVPQAGVNKIRVKVKSIDYEHGRFTLG